MRLNVRVDVHTRAKEVMARGEGFAADFALTFAQEAAEVARRNVSPGRGPGPHPHRPPPEFREHIDTGKLRDSIHVTVENRGFLKSARIYSTVAYAAHLEYGWTARSGRHWRYPFLAAAVEEVKHRADTIARSSARRWLSEDGAPYRGRVNPSAPSTATFFPEQG